MLYRIEVLVSRAASGELEQAKFSKHFLKYIC